MRRACAGRRRWPYGLAAFALPFALYCRTAAPTVYGVDSAELTTAAHLLGIVHPPGSPAYLLLGHVFTWLPIGDVGFRLNLLSATAAALTTLLLFAIVDRLTAARGIALLTALLTAATYGLWTAAVAAEVYAPQASILLALIALALRWRAGGGRATFVAACGLAGLALGVHLGSALLLPGLAVLALAGRQPTATPPPLVAGALALLAGASVYAYLPLRHLADLPLDPARDYWDVDLASWSGFSWMVSGGGFRRLFFAVPLADIPARLLHIAHWLWSTFLGLGALLGAGGLAYGLRRAPAIHGGLVLMLLGHLAFFAAYGAGDTDAMNLPILLLWAVWVGVGGAAAADWLDARLPAAGPPAVGAGLGTLLLLLLWLNAPWADLSRDRSARERGEAILGALAPQALFVGSWADLRVVEYLQQVEGRRPDVTLFDAYFAGDAARAARIAAGLASGRPVYVGTCRDLPDARLRCEPIAACDCHRVVPADEATN